MNRVKHKLNELERDGLGRRRESKRHSDRRIENKNKGEIKRERERERGRDKEGEDRETDN